MDFIKDFFKLKFMEGIRTYTGIVGLWLLHITEWSGLDVPNFEPMGPLDLLSATLIALGIYERIKKQ